MQKAKVTVLQHQELAALVVVAIRRCKLELYPLLLGALITESQHRTLALAWQSQVCWP